MLSGETDGVLFGFGYVTLRVYQADSVAGVI